MKHDPHPLSKMVWSVEGWYVCGDGCGAAWRWESDYQADLGPCDLAWTDRKAAELAAPIVWAGTEADAYALAVTR